MSETETENTALENHVVTLVYTLKNINEIINMMNRPVTTPVMAWANIINDMHMQVGPQVQKFNAENGGKDESAA